MTSGKPPDLPRQLTPERDENQPREGEADKERREMMPRQPESSASESAGLDARLQAKIGQTLKAMFDEVAKAPIPDKFLDLLNKLEVQEKNK
jgi:Anti-sigma factor NepR